MERSPEKYSSFLSVQFMKRMRYERRGDVTLLQSTFHTRHASRSGFPVTLVSISEGTIETNGYFLSELDASLEIARLGQFLGTLILLISRTSETSDHHLDSTLCFFPSLIEFMMVMRQCCLLFPYKSNISLRLYLSLNLSSNSCKK